MSAPRSPTETKVVPSGGRPIVSTVSAQTADSRVWGVTPLGGRAQIVWWARPRCKRRGNCVPPAGRGSVALSADPNQFQTRHKLRRGLSFLVSTVLAHGRHNGTRFLRPGGTQLLRRLEREAQPR